MRNQRSICAARLQRFLSACRLRDESKPIRAAISYLFGLTATNDAFVWLDHHPDRRSKEPKRPTLNLQCDMLPERES